MAVIHRLRVSWSGSAITGGGVSTFHFFEMVAGQQAAVKTLFNDLKTYMPGTVTTTVPNSGDIIESTTGDVIGTWVEGTAGSYVGGVAGANYARGVGARIVWDTAGRRNNRRVRGSTFVVPLFTGAYDTDGTIVPAVLSTYATAAAAVLAVDAGNMCIWSRPTAGTEDGMAHPVIASSVPDKTSWLVSRRT